MKLSWLDLGIGSSVNLQDAQDHTKIVIIP